MLNFTERMKRTIQLAEQCIVHVQEKKYDPALKDLVDIGNNNTQAYHQVSDLMDTISQGTVPPEENIE